MADFLARLAARALGQSAVLQPLQVPSAAPSPAAAQLPGDWESLVEVEAGAPLLVTPVPWPSLDPEQDQRRRDSAPSPLPRSGTSGAPAEAAAMPPPSAPRTAMTTAPASAVSDAALSPAAGLPRRLDLPRRDPESGVPRGATPVPPADPVTLVGAPAVQPPRAAPPLPSLRRTATPGAEVTPQADGPGSLPFSAPVGADPPLERAVMPDYAPPARRTLNPPPRPVPASSVGRTATPAPPPVPGIPVGRTMTPTPPLVPGVPVGDTAARALEPRREPAGPEAVTPREAPADRVPLRLAPSSGLTAPPTAGPPRPRMLTARLPASLNEEESPALSALAAPVDGSGVAGPRGDLPPGPPPAPAVRAVTLPGQPAARLRGPAQDGPPTIRVTIGRVEVRAAQLPAPPPPAAPRTPPRPRRPVLTLAEYLQRRSPPAEGRRPSGEGR